jgi:hypothetical protein
MIFNNEIYVMREKDYYTRSYMKIQDFGAIVGGIIKIVFFITNIFIEVTNKLEMSLDIAKKTYSFDDEKTTSSLMPSLNKHEELKSTSNAKFISHKIYREIQIINKNKIETGSKISSRKILCNKIACRRNSYFNMVISRAYEKMEIITYLDLLNEFEKLKKYLLNDFEQKCFNFMKKKNISEENPNLTHILSLLKNEIKSKGSTNTLSEKEKLLFSMVNESVILEKKDGL